MEKEKVSVIIPTHEPEEYLLRAIDSVITQSYKNMEIIVVDDCSSINVKRYLRSYRDKINLIELSQNKGPACARNIGADYSTGDLLAFLDDDDEWKSDKIEKQVKAIDQEHLICTTDLIDEFEGKKEYIKHEPPKNKTAQIAHILKGKLCNVTPSILVNREIFYRAGGFDESLKRYEDRFFIMRCLELTNLKHLSDFLFIRHKRESGLSSSEPIEDIGKNTENFIHKCRTYFDIKEKIYKEVWSGAYLKIAYRYLQSNKKIKVLQYSWRALLLYHFNKEAYKLLLYSIIPLDYNSMKRIKSFLQKVIKVNTRD